jgi:hypothetical protein
VKGELELVRKKNGAHRDRGTTHLIKKKAIDKNGKHVSEFTTYGL